jgi:hypothetical protein
MSAVTELGGRIFRNNVGQGWIGHGAHTGTSIFIENPRPLHAGLCKGSGDGIGWHTIEITPDMVGKRVAVFLSVETKAQRGRATSEQINWDSQVRAAGGISVIAKSVDDVTLAIRKYFPV